VVVGLCIRPPVCFGKILQSADEICCRNCVLALRAKEFQDFVLLHPEVEACWSGASCSASCGSTRGSSGNLCGSGSVAIVIITVMAISVDVSLDFDLILTFNSRHCCVREFL
jgi:hypothetical protein